MRFLLFTFFISFSVLAGFDGLMVKNLDLDYSSPYGKGELEKISIGLSKSNSRYPVEVEKSEDAFYLRSPFIDLRWGDPLKFFYDLEVLIARKINFSIGKTEHYVHGDHLTSKPKGQGIFKFDHLNGRCSGQSSEENIAHRLFADCRESMDLKIKRLDVPVDFFMLDILNQLPPIPAEVDIPADHFSFVSKGGEFSLVLYLKYYVYAGLRVFGNFHYEGNFETIVIKVNQIKWGYLPVTGLVMRELRNRIKHPAVKIEPPFIRIKIKS
jgi:hypothetical protein